MKSASGGRRGRAQAPAPRGLGPREPQAAPRAPRPPSPGRAAGPASVPAGTGPRCGGEGGSPARLERSRLRVQLRDGGKRTPGEQGPAGTHARHASPGSGVESPRGPLRSRPGRLCRRPPFSEALKSPPRQETPGTPAGESRSEAGQWPPLHPKSRSGEPLTRGGCGGCSGARGARRSPKVEGHVAGARDQEAAPATMSALRVLIRRGNLPRIAEFRLFSGLAYGAGTLGRRGVEDGEGTPGVRLVSGASWLPVASRVTSEVKCWKPSRDVSPESP